MAEQKQDNAYGTVKQDLIKVSVGCTRNKDVAPGTPHTWLADNIMPRMIVLIQKHGIKHYNSVSSPPHLREEMEELRREIRSDKTGWQVSDADLTVSYYLESLDQLRQLHKDPDFLNLVHAGDLDEINVFNPDVRLLTIGWETVWLRDGKIVNCEPKFD